MKYKIDICREINLNIYLLVSALTVIKLSVHEFLLDKTANRNTVSNKYSKVWSIYTLLFIYKFMKYKIDICCLWPCDWQ
jgi:hypothetical protein